MARAKRVSIVRRNALLGAARKPPPPPRYANPNVIPGIGGYRHAVHKQQRAARNPTFDGPRGFGQPKSTTGRQQAPFKPGQTEVTRRRKRSTRPNPGSVYGQRKPRWS